MRIYAIIAAISLSLLQLQCCNPLMTILPAGIELNMEADSAIFAVIGDYGYDSKWERKVSEMVHGWGPDFIITLGDNNYKYGDYMTLQQNIGKYYGDYIYNYDAPESYQCHGTAFEDSTNRFFPTPGNHDEAGSQGLVPYLNYFTLPGEETYYSFSWGNATFFSINSLPSSDFMEEKLWLEEEIAKANGKFIIVYFHHPPYSPGSHGDSEHMQWDFFEWGADVIMSGHDHVYARMEKETEQGLYYIVNGMGGKSLYTYGDRLDPEISTLFKFNETFGAMRCKISNSLLELAFYSIDDPLEPIDHVIITK